MKYKIVCLYKKICLGLFLSIFFFIIFQKNIIAQNKKALVFLQRFQYKTNDSHTCPFYLQNNALADSVAQVLDIFLQKNYQTSTLSRKKINLVDCMEYMGENEELRTIQNTNFDYSVSFVNKLEIKKIKNTKNVKISAYKLLLNIELEIFDKERKRIGRFKAKQEAELKEVLSENTKENTSPLPPLQLSEQDFKTLYFHTLQKTFGQNSPTQAFDFKAQTPPYLADFVENATPHTLIWIERLALSLQTDTIIRVGLDVDSFKENDTIIARTARLKNPFDKKNYQLQAFTHPRKTHQTQVDFYQGKSHFGSLQKNTLQNENLVKGKIKEEYLTWENFGAYKMGFYKKKLVMYATFQKTNTIEKENLGQYTLYIPKNLPNNMRAMWLNVFLGEALMDFVGKYAQK